MLIKLFEFVKKEIPFLENLMIRSWYWYVSTVNKNGGINFLNYGFAGNNNITLHKEDEDERYPIQLYHYVVTHLDLKKRKVLEVGCGRGGGSSYINRYLNPEKIVGIDICKKSIAFCHNAYKHKENIHFVRGNAMNLDDHFDVQHFDVIVNIESSHRYQNISQFLDGAYKITRPNGHMLLADFRDSHEIESLKKSFSASGWKLVKEENITLNVVKALELDDSRRQSLIRQLTPRLMHNTAREFSGTKGTRLYDSFVQGKRKYYYFVLKKKAG